MIKLVDAVNYLQSNGYMVKNENNLYNIIEVRTKKYKFSHLTSPELIELVEKMMIGI
jgi:hypothetical protein